MYHAMKMYPVLK